MMLHKKGDDIPKEWYSISRPQPMMSFKFAQDCESIKDGQETRVRTISGKGCYATVNNAHDVNIIMKNINFITKQFSDIASEYHSSYLSVVNKDKDDD